MAKKNGFIKKVTLDSDSVLVPTKKAFGGQEAEVYEFKGEIIVGGRAYTHAMRPSVLANLIGCSVSGFRSGVSGRAKCFFPRTFLKIQKDLPVVDDGEIAMLRLYFGNKTGAINLVPIQSFYNIATAYKCAYEMGLLKAHQIGLGAKYTRLHPYILGVCKDKEPEKDDMPNLDKAFNRVFDDEIFEVEYPYLLSVLKKVYPDRPDWKYKALSVTVFKYAYEDILGGKNYRELQKKREFLAPLHQHINDPLVRQKLKAYIVAFATVMYSWHKDAILEKLAEIDNVAKTRKVRIEIIKIFTDNGVIGGQKEPRRKAKLDFS